MQCAGCKVHSGFYDCWKGLDAPMVEHVRALREAHPAAPVYVTGHSLGGMVAMSVAVRLPELVVGGLDLGDHGLRFEPNADDVLLLDDGEGILLPGTTDAASAALAEPGDGKLD